MFKPLVTHSTSLYNRIADEIKGALAEGKLQPGDRLPPERELCEQLGVSRTSLREALKILEGNGILTIRHGQGIFVADANPHQLMDKLARLLLGDSGSIAHLFEIRRLLETAAAGWAAERAKTEQLEALAQVVSTAKSGAASGAFTIADYERHDMIFHSLLADATGNTVMVRVMENLMDMLRKARQSSLNIPGRPQQSIADHEEILNAVLMRNPARASEAMLEHLEGVETSIVTGMNL